MNRKNKLFILICILFIGIAVSYIFNTIDVQPAFPYQSKADSQDSQSPLTPSSHKENAVIESEIRGISDDVVRGDPDASVVIVEFCDFQYKECAKAYPAVKRVLEAYSGKVKFVYRDFPLSDVHAFAQDAAEAAECAGEQGKYWEYHDKLFEYQQEWVEKGMSQLKKYAEELKLDMEKFNSCVDSGKFKEEVLKDFNDGKYLGINSVPFFLINNRTLTGARTFEDIQNVIEKEINRLKERQEYGEIEFYSFEKGIEKAKRYNKTVLVYFRSDSCYWCMKFDEEVLTNKSVVKEINENFIPVAVDIDGDKKISAELNVFMTPTILFIDVSGNELKRLIGFRDAGKFLEELKSPVRSSNKLSSMGYRTVYDYVTVRNSTI